jgi:hypothetical protein
VSVAVSEGLNKFVSIKMWRYHYWRVAWGEFPPRGDLGEGPSVETE